MHDQPDGPTLLRIARATLLDSVLPALSGERRYAGLMVAQAMAIALRELDDTGDAAGIERAQLAARYPDMPDDADLAALRRRLVADIRAGTADDDAEVTALIRAQVRGRLALTRPELLQGPE